MEKIKGYHSTTDYVISSIAKFGLVPNYGDNSDSIEDKRALIFFSSKNDYYWEKRFNKDKPTMITFYTENEAKYFWEEAQEMYTSHCISPENIRIIINNNEVDLLSYYNANKKYYDELLRKTIESDKEDFFNETNSEKTIQIGMKLWGECMVFQDEYKDLIGLIQKRIKEILNRNKSSNYLIEQFGKILDTDQLEKIFKFRFEVAQGYSYDPEQINITQDNCERDLQKELQELSSEGTTTTDYKNMIGNIKWLKRSKDEKNLDEGY